MAIVQVGTETVASKTATGTTLTVTRNLAAGSLGVILISTSAASSITVTGVTDSAAQTWTQGPVGFLTGNNTRAEIWYALALASAITSVTLTQSAGAVGIARVSEWSGQATLDVIANASAASSTTGATAPVTTTAAGDLVIGVETFNNITSVPTLGTTGTSTGFTAFVVSRGASTISNVGAYLIAGAAGSYGPTWTYDVAAASGTATASFKAAASAAQLALPRRRALQAVNRSASF